MHEHDRAKNVLDHKHVKEYKSARLWSIIYTSIFIMPVVGLIAWLGPFIGVPLSALLLFLVFYSKTRIIMYFVTLLVGLYIAFLSGGFIGAIIFLIYIGIGIGQHHNYYSIKKEIKEYHNSYQNLETIETQTKAP